MHNLVGDFLSEKKRNLHCKTTQGMFSCSLQASTEPACPVVCSTWLFSGISCAVTWMLSCAQAAVPAPRWGVWAFPIHATSGFVLEVDVSSPARASLPWCWGYSSFSHFSASGEKLCVSKRWSTTVLTLQRELVTSFCRLCPEVTECGEKFFPLVSVDVCCMLHQQARNTNVMKPWKLSTALCAA